MQDKKNNEEIDLSGVQFQHESQRLVGSFDSNTPKIVQAVIKYSGGLVKGEKQANYVLIGLVMVTILISLFLILGKSEDRSDYDPVPVTGRESEDVNWPPLK